MPKTSTILLIVGAVVVVLLLRSRSGGGTTGIIDGLFSGGAGAEPVPGSPGGPPLTSAQLADISAHPESRTGRGHF